MTIFSLIDSEHYRESVLASVRAQYVRVCVCARVCEARVGERLEKTS